MNIFKLTITPTSEGRTLVYDTKIKSYGNLWTTIFTGKVYALPNQSEVKIDLEDILWNYKFDGTDYFAPMLNTTGDDYVLCNTYNTLNNYWYNLVQVEIPELNVSVSKNVCFFNNRMFDTPIKSVDDNTIVFNMDYQPTAHIPINTPSNFYFRALVWNGSFLKGVDGQTSVEQRSKLGQITFTGGSKSYSLNGKTIAVIDQCPKPYYLVWMTNCGTMQIQGFLKSSEVKIDYENNTRINMSDYEFSFNKLVRGSWKLKSQNLTDVDYRAYGQIFDSPYLLLIDTKNGRQHFVNVKSDTYNEKKNTNGKHKIYFEIEVEACEKKKI